MRAREFTINVPITIKINGDDDPEISTNDVNGNQLHQNPVMVSPLQQDLELRKAELGKSSPVIDKLTANDDIGQEPNQDKSVDLDRAFLQKLKALISR
jgi:phosphatidate phosphatase PAH1